MMAETGNYLIASENATVLDAVALYQQRLVRNDRRIL